MNEMREFAPGLRLERLEVYNWGTFNGRIWSITPRGGTALLTGANGSGKSSLVDALLTLLVAPQRCNYNQSAGGEKRRERTDKTYVQGAWSKRKEEEHDNASMLYLRGKDMYTVLLAVFQNPRYGQTVTIVQLFWWQENELRRLYVIAPFALSIEDAFRISSVNSIPVLRKQLRSSGAFIYDNFSKYMQHFRKLAYLYSEKANDLFHQVVSIKDIDSLEKFVRNHMLEKIDPTKDIEALHNTYANLSQAYQAIQLAEEQLAILEPLMEDANKYEAQMRRIIEAQACAQLVPLYIAHHRKQLLDEVIVLTCQQLEEQIEITTTLDQQLEELRQQEVGLKVAIQQDQIGQQIEALGNKIRAINQNKDKKKTQSKKYTLIAQQLGLPEYEDRATFRATLQQIPSLLSEASQKQEEYMGKRDACMQEVADLRKQCQLAEEELQSLRQRKSQIPKDDIRIREQITSALQISEEELPFVGELVRVRKSELRWEGAIERILSGFGRRLLVPEQHYERVSRYVDSVHLRGRLVYSRISNNQIRQPVRQTNQQMLANKLEVKPDTLFSDWLIHELVTTYDYLCCETVEEFQQARRAVSIRGQIKHSFDRHEKDDRYALNDRTKYILGWNNTEKLAAIEAVLAKLEKKRQQAEGDVKRIKFLMDQEWQRHDLLRQLQAFDDFETIDWRTDEVQTQDLTRRKRELEESADHLAELQGQLTRVIDLFNEKNQQRDNAHSLVARSEQSIDNYKKDRSRCQHLLHEEMREEYHLFLQSIERDAQAHAHLLKLERMDEAKDKITQMYNRRISSFQGTLNTLRGTLEERMRIFRNTSTRIAQEVDATVDAIPAYRHYHEKITRDGLPRHRQRFKELLNDKIILAISVFKETLELQQEDIETNLAHLNESLRSITYTQSTYIQLCHRANRDPQIREFHNMLRACLPDVSQAETSEMNEISFKHVQALIERFKNEERWTAKVTDVRNWMTFWAEELYREDGTRKNYYDDSSGLSGGQKAKLASTILASAIAYQYGLNHHENSQRALRFIVIDEAFSRSDEMNARYAMDLFKQLDLQVLIVTPLEKLHIVEPYISACHYVTNTEQGNDSKVYNLTIEEYHHKKQSWQEVVA